MTRIKVLFMVDQGGEVVALFPEVPATMGGALCVCYSRVGQHGALTYGLALGKWSLATPDEYAPLLAELTTTAGYAEAGLDICTSPPSVVESARARHAAAVQTSEGRVT